MKIWAILGARRGDNNQVLALAEALGMPFEIRHLRYNRLRHLGPRLLGPTFRSLDRRSRARILDGEPDVTISTGHRSVPVVQALRRRSGGRLRSIHLNYPRLSPDHFDLVVATPEYPIPDHPRLRRIPFALTRAMASHDPDLSFWQKYPGPRRLLIIGGPTLYWRLAPGPILTAADDLLAEARTDGGSVLVVGSPRTPARLLARVRDRIAGASPPAAVIELGGLPSYPELLRRADTIAVTADSVMMVSEAIASGKPVGLVPIEPTAMGAFAMTVWDRLRPGQCLHPRDLRRFWRAITDRKLVGTAAKPRTGPVPDLNGMVAGWVRAIAKIDDS